MTPDDSQSSAGAATAESTSPATTVATEGSRQPDEFDSMRWEVPLICKDCGKDFKVPYRHFQAGVVFHCPHCHGSFVPKTTIYRTVREAFETFYSRRKRAYEDFARVGGDETAFKLKQERELEQFRQHLDVLAQEMRPAGKMVRPKGLAAMFS